MSKAGNTHTLHIRLFARGTEATTIQMRHFVPLNRHVTKLTSNKERRLSGKRATPAATFNLALPRINHGHFPVAVLCIPLRKIRLLKKCLSKTLSGDFTNGNTKTIYDKEELTFTQTER
jgi:hypothetical protein